MLPFTNVTMTSDFDFGLDHPAHGGYGRGRPTRTQKVTVKERKLKCGHRPHRGPGAKTNWRTDRNLNFNLCHCTENYRPVLSSERAPYMKKKESNCHSKKCKICSLAPKWARHQDELVDWPSQYNLNLNLESGISYAGGLDCLQRSPESCKERRKGNPMPGGITGPPCSWRT
jgi:hypothetical protein